MAWPRHVIDEVRRSVDPLRLIGEVVNLKRRGARHVGLCPFHQEKTPSFTVNDEGLWYCFGCGTGGDLFKFVMQQEGVDFGDAVRSLADRSGLQLPSPESRSVASGTRQSVSRQRLLAALRLADRFYRQQLTTESGARAREYLTSRGFTPQIVDNFGLGYAPNAWRQLQRHLVTQGTSEPEMVAAGLVRRKDSDDGAYDLLRDRIVFPILDPGGRTIAFGGRVIDHGDPKYLNSPETRVFHKSRTLYGLSAARQAIRQRGFVLLVEGYLDLLACSQHGFTNVVAPLGTSLTEDHARLLSRYTRKAVVGFDGDTAGQAAAERTVGTFLTAGFQVSVVQLADGQDPDAFLAEHGAEEFVELLRRALPALSFLVGRLRLRHDLKTPQGKARAATSLLQQIQAIDSRVERAEWIGRIAEALEVERHLLEQTAAELRVAGRRRSSTEPDSARSGAATEGLVGRLAAPALAERGLLRAVLANPRWLPRLESLYGTGSIRDSRVLELLDALAAARAVTADEEISSQDLLSRCDSPEAAALMSRLVLDEAPAIDWDGARDCALGIRRDALKRSLRDVQISIELAEAEGDEPRLAELAQRKQSLAREIQTT